MLLLNKKNFFLAFFIASVAIESSSKASNPTNDPTVAFKPPAETGFVSRILGANMSAHVGLVKPNFSFKLDQTEGSQKFNGEVAMDSAIGIGAGLSYLPVGNLGWDAQLTYFKIDNHPVFKDAGSSTITVDSLQRTEGNLAYAFNRYFYIKGGLNLSTVSTSNTESKLNSGIGFQLGAVAHLADHIAANISYFSTSHQTANSSSYNGVDTSVNLKTKIEGLEFGVAAVF
ncbi:MAG: hypothetical protein ACXVCP_06740 [Bdellovibrio sp.]